MKTLFIALLLLGSPMFVFADEATTTPELATSTPIIATSTTPVSTPISVEKATITIRNGAVAVFTGAVEIASSTIPLDITPTNSSTTIAISPDSLLATLVALDATTADFDITDLAYFSSFDSFIINCIAIPSISTPDCYSWTYAVNGSFPQIGIDDTILHDGDIVHLFFGPPRQTTLSTTTVVVGEQFTATAQSYDLGSGIYVGTPNLTIGVGTANPDFTFTELATSTSGASGDAIFTLNATGTFSVGIQEDFYFPSVSITVIDASTEATSTPPTDNSPPSGGGGGGGISHSQLNVSQALAYLASKQSADGSFGSSLLSDWAALAFAASDPGVAKTNLRNYLLTATPVFSNTTDYERHAMALMALGINPYSDTPTDYISHITSAFDGTQIGDSGLDNDDIFALFPLLHAGYSANDDIIQKTTAFILSAQQTSGAWDASVDMTAAAIQALALVPSLHNVSGALAKAESYLRSQQKWNGGFDGSFSTSWALQAIVALGQSPSNWAPSGYNPNDYLASQQQGDGGVEPTSSNAQTRMWATEYAIPASLGKTWSSLLQSFAKPTNATTGTVAGAATSSLPAATSTASVATSTPPIATSTLPATTPTAGVATSTPPTTIASAVSTSSPKATSSRETAPRPTTAKIIPNKTTQTIASTTPATSLMPLAQTATVTSYGTIFFSKLWHAVTSFFVSLF